MRRPVATALLLLMLAAFLAPAALATITTPMPACCRARGAHHCAMMVPSGGETQAKGQGCPYRRHPAFSVTAATPTATQAAAPAPAHSFLNGYYSEVFVSHRESPHSQRGPPPDSSLK
jgi:hypothetical protein